MHCALLQISSHRSRHFKSTAFERSLKYELLGLPVPPGKKKFKPGAVPTLHIPIYNTSRQLTIPEEAAAVQTHAIEPQGHQDAETKLLPQDKKLEHDIKKALTLRTLSPKAYRFIREQWNYPMPSSATISRWISTFDVDPGILN
ncbi:hypothetical protein Pmani_030054 [Petrolisthes manimaculis]|uniref:THAP9-like helix-turn-helix domain-containing protein n=1 Tax=Petrolisthes manimaculis TaxID=1843537 RepID=A0AAE1TT92_9EUCA|nr:hypothetical protein Pmani_030054 [Petrolisthes manimaculis]